MKKIVPSAFLLFSFLGGFAQAPDSAFYDIGHIQLRKDFTQTVTIKGADLQKLPFSNLADAIDGWLYGNYSNSGFLLYVIDGHVIADVNTYSIQDIEDITLIQNAAAGLNGAFRQQQLVVIRTKKGKGTGTGISASGMGHLVDKKYYDPALHTTRGSEKNVFHQYQVSAYRKTERLNTGASIGFLHNVMPAEKDDNLTVQTADHINRYRLNTYADWRAHPDHTISFRVNFVTQPNASAETRDFVVTQGLPRQEMRREGKNPMLNLELGWQSKWGKGFTNRLSGAYTRLSATSDQVFHSELPPNFYTSEFHTEKKYRNLVVEDVLRYSWNHDNWSFSPALDFSFRKVRENTKDLYNITSSGSLQHGESFSQAKGKFILLTPSFDIAWKDAFNLQAGAVGNLSKYKTRTFHPYATASLDLLRLQSTSAQNSLKLFGSYSITGYFSDYANNLDEFNGNSFQSPPPQSFFFSNALTDASPDATYTQWQAGTVAALLQQRLVVNYQFESRQYIGATTLYVPSLGTLIALRDFKSAMHRIGADILAVKNNAVQWRTGLHLTTLRNVTKASASSNFTTAYYVNGDVAPQNRSWTGGWNNRLQMNRLSIGADLLAHLGKMARIESTPERRFNAVGLHYAFIGYELELKGKRNAEVYLSLRDAAQNVDYAALRDSRRYFGAGFKFNFFRQRALADIAAIN